MSNKYNPLSLWSSKLIRPYLHTWTQAHTQIFNEYPWAMSIHGGRMWNHFTVQTISLHSSNNLLAFFPRDTLDIEVGTTSVACDKTSWSKCV